MAKGSRVHLYATPGLPKLRWAPCAIFLVMWFNGAHSFPRTRHTLKHILDWF